MARESSGSLRRKASAAWKVTKDQLLVRKGASATFDHESLRSGLTRTRGQGCRLA